MKCDDCESLREKLEDAQNLYIASLRLIARIREAAGDPGGKLMQDELVEHIKTIEKRARGSVRK